MKDNKRINGNGSNPKANKFLDRETQKAVDAEMARVKPDESIIPQGADYVDELQGQLIIATQEEDWPDVARIRGKINKATSANGESNARFKQACTLAVNKATQEAKEAGKTDKEVDAAGERAKKEFLEKAEKAKLKPTSGDLGRALNDMGIQFRCNADLSEAWEFKLAGDDKFSDWREQKLISIREKLSDDFNYLRRTTKGPVEEPLYFSTMYYWETISALMEDNKAYPFRDYLKSCKIDNDCQFNLDNWLIETLQCDDTDLNRWASKTIFLAAVSRVFEPGCAQRTIPMLIGAPGIGKSSAIGGLMPSHLAHYFSDDFSFEGDNKSKIEQTKEHVLVEITELGGIRKAEVAMTKAYLDRKIDKVRLAYGRKQESFPRKFSLVATGNKEANALPSDPALLDRVCVVECHSTEKRNMTTFMDEHREHFWALAYKAYMDGERCYSVPKELQNEQADASENIAFHDDSLIENVRKIKFTNQEYQDGLTLNEIAIRAGEIEIDNEGRLKGSLSKKDQWRLGVVLKELNFKASRTESRRFWIPPKPKTSDPF